MDAGRNISSEGNYFHRHLHYAISLLNAYGGKEPFHLYLKNYFRQEKKHGSRDRKAIAALCYDYFRLGTAVSREMALAKRILIAHFLLRNTPSDLLEKFEPQWNQNIGLELPDKLKSLEDFIDLKSIFPFPAMLSEEIDPVSFSYSFLHQPQTFIRIRPGNTMRVIQKLEEKKIGYERFSPDCLALANSVPVTDILRINREAVIQDLNSQHTGEFLKKIPGAGLKVWDCCAASGGKSILAYDILNNPKLTVSDTRTGILQNLKVRFQQAGINNYQSFVIDLTKKHLPTNEEFDVIIADVPCSGSGTWARTPEQLQYFKSPKIDEYALLQQQILTRTLKNLKKDGYLLYITCSVFFTENERNVQWLENKGLQVIDQQYLKGYDKRADTLFACLLKLN